MMLSWSSQPKRSHQTCRWPSNVMVNCWMKFFYTVAAIFRKKRLCPSRLFFCLALQSALMYICRPQRELSLKYQYCLYIWDYASLTTLNLWIYVVFPSQWTPAHAEPSISVHGQCNSANKQDPCSKIIAVLLSQPILLSLPNAQCRTENTHGFRGGKCSLTLGTRGGRFYWIAILVYWIFPMLEGFSWRKTFKTTISPEVGIYDAESVVTLFKGQALKAMRIVGEHKSA